MMISIVFLLGILIFLSLPLACSKEIESRKTILAFASNAYVASAFIGGGSSFSEGMQASSANLGASVGVFVDLSGNTYTTDNNNRVCKVSTSNILTTFGGGSPGTTGDGGAATSATLSVPVDVWCSSDGTCYVLVQQGFKVRRISTGGIITTYVGTGTASTAVTASNGDGGQATAASISTSNFITGNTMGSLFIGDTSNNKVRKVTTSGIISTVFGSGAESNTGDGGAATAATINGISGVHADSNGNVYVVNRYISSVRMVSNNQIVSLFAGNYNSMYNGDGQAATSTSFNSLRGIWLDSSNNFWAADMSNYRVRVIQSGIVFTIAGGSTQGTSGNGGMATAALFTSPLSVSGDTSGNVVVSDNGVATVRKLILLSPTVLPTVVPSVLPTRSPSVCPTIVPSLPPSLSPSIAPSMVPSVSPTITPTVRPTMIVSGSNAFLMSAFIGAGSTFFEGMPATSANLGGLRGVFADTAGNTYTTDNSNRVCKINSLNILVTFAGGSPGTSGDGGPATSATMTTPVAGWCAVDGTCYLMVRGEYKVRMISTNGIITTYVGTGAVSSAATAANGDGGQATAATIGLSNFIYGNSVNSLFIGDTGNNKIRKVASDGIVSTVAGSGIEVYSGDGGAATAASMTSIAGVHADSNGNVYVSSMSQSVVRVISNNQIITLFAGNSFSMHNGDGLPATATSFNSNRGVWLDSANNLYLADYLNFRVRVVQSGIVYTVAGNSNQGTSGNDGMASSALLTCPYGVTGDAVGNVVVADICQIAVRKMILLSPTVQPTISPSVVPSTVPTITPTVLPTISPSVVPSIVPTTTPSVLPTRSPSLIPTLLPTLNPTVVPTVVPSVLPTVFPTKAPTLLPSVIPTTVPSIQPSAPSIFPSLRPTTLFPSIRPTVCPSFTVTFSPTVSPSSLRSSQNNIKTIAGTGTAGSTGTSGRATAMTLNSPRAVWKDSMGVVYVGEDVGNCVRKFSYPTGNVVNVAGVGGSTGAYGGDSGPATAALFNRPLGLCVADSGEVYIGDYNNNRVRVVSNDIVTTLLGLGTTTNTGDDGPATSASSGAPHGLWMDSLGQLYVAVNGLGFIKMIDTSMIVSSIAGIGVKTYSGDGGPATSAALNGPARVFMETTGKLHIGDSGSHRFRSIDLNGVITTIVGTGITTYNNENIKGTACNINGAYGVAVDTSNGDMYLASTGNDRIQVLTKSSGLVTTFAGSGTSAYAGDSGAASSASVNGPDMIYLTDDSHLFIADGGNNRVREVYTVTPTAFPTRAPSQPTSQPSRQPTGQPTRQPSRQPSMQPTMQPSGQPTNRPSSQPTNKPSEQPTSQPSQQPSSQPSGQPTSQPSAQPSQQPSTQPSGKPSVRPSCEPSSKPSRVPSSVPSSQPSSLPTVRTVKPSLLPTPSPSLVPTVLPSLVPSCIPTTPPTLLPSMVPTQPTVMPNPLSSLSPSNIPTILPSARPSLTPSCSPTALPSLLPSLLPTVAPSIKPTVDPSFQPSVSPSLQPSPLPTVVPTFAPSVTPSFGPTFSPSFAPSVHPIVLPTCFPSVLPTVSPSTLPTIKPTVCPTVQPSHVPSLVPSKRPTILPTVPLTDTPTVASTINPTQNPNFINFNTLYPSQTPSCMPSHSLSVMPSEIPSELPSEDPSDAPSAIPSTIPSAGPSERPSYAPTVSPSLTPSLKPSVSSSAQPSVAPSTVPNAAPSMSPTTYPTTIPSVLPSVTPSMAQSILLVTALPSIMPTLTPSIKPSEQPTLSPSCVPSHSPSVVPTLSPSACPTLYPSVVPSVSPSLNPSQGPSCPPSYQPTSCKPTNTPITVLPSAAPSTVEFYNVHPKATLPSNDSISVIGFDKDFKIVLSFNTMTNGPFGSPFTDIYLFSGAVVAGAYLLQSNKSVDLSSDFAGTTFTDAVRLDTAKRSASVLKDVNGDGDDDLIIGDPYAARCYVLFGNNKGLTDMIKGFTIFGESEGDLTGWSVSGAGDVNNDTLADIIVGAPNVKGVGAFYVIYGRRLNIFDVYLSNLTASQGFAMYGAQKSDYLGISVSNAGDVNGDGCDDIIVGSLQASLFYIGSVFVLFGCSTLNAINTAALTSTQAMTITGVPYSYTGCSVSAAGDVNKDSLADVLISTSPQRPSLLPGSYVIFGTKQVSETILLSSLTASQGFRITGGGSSVSRFDDTIDDRKGGLLIAKSFSSVSSVGYIVISNVSHLTAQSVSPTVAPITLVPTRRIVSRTPTLTRTPTVLPSLKPTLPTVVPSVSTSSGGSEVPSCDSIRPSEIPTVAPSDVPSQVPSMEPSEPPIFEPTAQPSLNPTLSPTVYPSTAPVQSAVPSTAPLSRQPFRIPSATPTLLTTEAPSLFTSVFLLSSISLSNQTQSHVNYLVNSTGAVSIENNKGFIRYTVIPQKDALLTIVYFNQSTDLIDLAAFTSITQFSQLQLSYDAATVVKLDSQMIRIVNLQPTDLTGDNFIFCVVVSASDDKSQPLNLAVIIVGAALGAVVAGLIVFGCCKGIVKIKNKEPIQAEDHFLFVLKTDSDGQEIMEKDGESDEEKSSDSINLSDFTVGDFSGSDDDDAEDDGQSVEWPSNPSSAHDSPALSDFTVNSDGDFMDKV